MSAACPRCGEVIPPISPHNGAWHFCWPLEVTAASTPLPDDPGMLQDLASIGAAGAAEKLRLNHPDLPIPTPFKI
jgi:hypothetical protein